MNSTNQLDDLYEMAAIKCSKCVSQVFSVVRVWVKPKTFAYMVRECRFILTTKSYHLLILIIKMNRDREKKFSLIKMYRKMLSFIVDMRTYLYYTRVCFTAPFEKCSKHLVFLILFYFFFGLFFFLFLYWEFFMDIII